MSRDTHHHPGFRNDMSSLVGLLRLRDFARTQLISPHFRSQVCCPLSVG